MRNESDLLAKAAADCGCSTKDLQVLTRGFGILMVRFNTVLQAEHGKIHHLSFTVQLKAPVHEMTCRDLPKQAQLLTFNSSAFKVLSMSEVEQVRVVQQSL